MTVESRFDEGLGKSTDEHEYGRGTRGRFSVCQSLFVGQDNFVFIVV